MKYDKGMIWAINGVLSKKECKEVLELSAISNDPITGDYDVTPTDEINKKITNVFLDYLNQNQVPNLYMFKGCRIQCTEGDIPLHTDLELYRGQEYLRHFTILTSLNGNDIIGGDLLFPTRNVSIKPKTGMLIIFPIGVLYPHQVLPCLSETKRFMLEQFHYFDYDNKQYGYIHERPTMKWTGPLLKVPQQKEEL